MTGFVTGAGVVSAWLVGEVSSSALARLSGTLDAEERRRAARLPNGAARRRFVIAHGAVRQIVAERLGAPPAELTWKTGPNGKPELVGEWSGIHANLSHSGDRCLIAVSTQRAVGADIQRLIPELDVAAMARRYFPEAEARDVADTETFARLWARKEAVTKAGGGRLTQVLPLLTPEGPVAALGSWYRVADVDAPPGFRAAVALAGADQFAVEMNEWTP
ncbi:4'-phosphopantetheinyl transferase superfamily protein [Catenulispora sp. NF23]|uniref:4'-phosphopantetheinyl transferase superfamily protein n=1 Tax=Catenulispora pinistramenti TaxID=2705254 RepID=A0ABS5L230_9ACTN|nr:4'-phosphopantetheinyl transferase superfamily protein [Catenulispora pinistramenti]MBS2539024.1 4'-phosphopantetheinyl transferase superfamily protein [Catenulispora pinistramenti]MBS2552393.1 4'-phosphopantetheinyl transferase superfamily protein [Catenulispora pinistramenti]